MFKDTKGHWAENSINRIADLSVLKGFPDGTFKPEQPVTRAEVAVLMDRLLFGWHELLKPIEGALLTITTPWSIGSGTHIGNGIILTNHHVIAKELEDGRFHIPDEVHFFNSTDNPRTALPPVAGAKAKPILLSPEYDLAVLQRTNYLHVNIPSIPLCDAAYIRTGEHVIAVGSPHGYSYTVTEGIISNPMRWIDYYDDNTRTKAVLMQIDAPINPGNSGGALLNRSGHLLGVPSAGVQGADGLGFAIRIDSVREWLDAHGVKYEDAH